jgi:tetratricopeptide (TPR) repeat protein
MESFDWANVDWATWGPPLAVLTLGLVGGLALVARGGARAEGDLRLANLEVRRQVLMNSLRELEADQAKLDPAAYAAQRTALVEEAAAVLREIDAPVSPAPAAGPSSAPRVGGSRAWAWAAGALAFFVLSGLVLQQAMAPRRDGGSMTGNQDLGGGAEAAQDARVQRAEATLAKNPNDLEAINLLTRVAIETQDLQSAMALLDRGRAINPADPGVLTHFAALQVFIGRFDAAEAQLRQVLEAAPGQSEAKLWLSVARATQGDLVEAEAIAQGLADDAAAPAEDRQNARALLSSFAAAKAQLAAQGAGGVGEPGAETSDATSESAPAEAGPAKVKGTVTGDVTPGGVLFVYVRRSETPGGPPLAAKRVPNWQLPYEFSLSDADLIQGGDWPEQVWVSAKVSRSGDPMQRSPEDVASAVVGPIKPGTEGVSLVLGAK